MLPPDSVSSLLSMPAGCFQISLIASEFLMWELDAMEKCLEPPKFLACEMVMSSSDSAKDTFQRNLL